VTSTVKGNAKEVTEGDGQGECFSRRKNLVLTLEPGLARD